MALINVITHWRKAVKFTKNLNNSKYIISKFISVKLIVKKI